MKTKKQLEKRFKFLIESEEKKENKDFTKILRFKRILEISQENELKKEIEEMRTKIISFYGINEMILKEYLNIFSNKYESSIKIEYKNLKYILNKIEKKNN
jgi:hypothetical protein